MTGDEFSFFPGGVCNSIDSLSFVSIISSKHSQGGGGMGENLGRRGICIETGAQAYTSGTKIPFFVWCTITENNPQLFLTFLLLFVH